MKLINTSGDYLSLSIQGYEFPEIHSCYYDSNWLNIAGKVKLGDKTCTFQNPCLLSFEALRLANWLDRIAKSKESLKIYDAPDFLEPELDFEFIKENRVRVNFNYGLLPERALSDEDGTDNLFLEFEPDKNMIKLATESLRFQLRSYPIRASNYK